MFLLTSWSTVGVFSSSPKAATVVRPRRINKGIARRYIRTIGKRQRRCSARHPNAKDMPRILPDYKSADARELSLIRKFRIPASRPGGGIFLRGIGIR